MGIKEQPSQNDNLLSGAQAIQNCIDLIQVEDSEQNNDNLALALVKNILNHDINGLYSHLYPNRDASTQAVSSFREAQYNLELFLDTIILGPQSTNYLFEALKSLYPGVTFQDSDEHSFSVRSIYIFTIFSTVILNAIQNSGDQSTVTAKYAVNDDESVLTVTNRIEKLEDIDMEGLQRKILEAFNEGKSDNLNHTDIFQYTNGGLTRMVPLLLGLLSKNKNMSNENCPITLSVDQHKRTCTVQISLPQSFHLLNPKFRRGSDGGENGFMSMMIS